jgi:CheY-like chemotaxis protein
VEEAANGPEALDRMRGRSPCIVLLDLMMPVTDGWQVVHEMELDPVLSTVRCVS